MARPQSATYPVYFDKYISLVNADDLISAFIDQRELIGGFFDSIPESKAAYAYAISSEADSRTWNSLCEELKQLRTSTELLFESFTPLQLEKSGKANGNPCTVIAAGFIIVGHVYHHQQIVIDRYL